MFLFDNTDENCMLLVYNAIGELIMTRKAGRTGKCLEEFDFSSLNRGLYFIKLQMNEDNIVKKVIRQ